MAFFKKKSCLTCENCKIYIYKGTLDKEGTIMYTCKIDGDLMMVNQNDSCNFYERVHKDKCRICFVGFTTKDLANMMGAEAE